MFKKILVYILFFYATSFKLLAANPGSNYGCLDFGSPVKFYTNWTSTLTSAPGNPGWMSSFQAYDANPQVYDVIYGPVECGQVNPSNSLQSASHEGQSTCFIFRDGIWSQGGLRTYTVAEVVPCPIDDHVAYLLVFILLSGCCFIHKRMGFLF